VWPEGFKGIGKPFSERYKLQRFGRGGFVSAALAAKVPIVPCSIVGQPVAVNPDARLRREARDNGWEIRDFRTGRKAAKVGIPAVAGTGAVVGGVVTGIAMRRRHQQRSALERVTAAARALMD
jgi:hypothetical protein